MKGMGLLSGLLGSVLAAASFPSSCPSPSLSAKFGLVCVNSRM